ncbi:hypothetical protein BAUCODRAFT_31576 [Baudoinia panamericana UAMH 10762]|uniref:Endonuclease III homolog n=1 Tax=Baudoinia panamericana (strain UAMH 10762) TaxID=717646 RepID=M2NIK6_BAUPA|nr:uncharacterized protein BAUCODRAFT_31576 [Baudoinia panamericana UAMH 10762]EMC99234.1 hypothetical protein BAUCODRAFT_31576 [Baudoinia panamericana UAMH 10762]
MRTSKVSRETQRVTSALTSIKRAGSGTGHARKRVEVGDGLTGDGTNTTRSNDWSISGLKDRLSETQASSTVLPSTTLGKRKREGTSTLATANIQTDVTNATAPRRSPRKAAQSADHYAHTDTTGKARRQPAKRVKGPKGEIAVEPPPNWERVYDVTAAMRKRVLAPVDTMGCESLAEDHKPPRDRRLQTLVSLMLSSQTKDTVTAVAMRNLQQNLPGGFCLESLLKVEPEQLNELIGKVGFHNNKTTFIKKVAVILRDQYDGDIPDTIEGLVSLPGVGPKMAYLCMSAAWGRDEGIGVDVHVHRITNLWGWHKTSTPEQTRAELEAWLPRDKWHDINHLLVGFGQTICVPVGRRCGECDLAKEGLCPSAVASNPVKRKARTKIEVNVDESEANVVKVEKVKVEQDEIAVKVEAVVGDGSTLEDVRTFTEDAERPGTN